MLTLIASNVFGQGNENRYPIIKDGLYGYIDQTGRIVIEPRFFAAGQFSEGLAAVRLKGTYGYIDPKGSFVIPPRFDIGLPFQNGVAKVFIDGKPFFINKEGNILFQHNYKSISAFDNNTFAIAITQTGRYGLINQSGDLIADTVFSEIGDFSNGVFIVHGLNHNPYPDDRTEKATYETGVIDTLGNWIVAYGRFKDIGNFVNGYAHVKLILERGEDEFYGAPQGIVDIKGKYKFTVPPNKWSFNSENEGFFQDIAIIQFYRLRFDTIDDFISINNNGYSGAINPNGDIILSDTAWKDLTPFSYNRAFARDKNGKWLLINTKGETVTPDSFEEVLDNLYEQQTMPVFQDGKAFVKTKQGWGAIDTTGKFVIGPEKFEGFRCDNVIKAGNILLLVEDISVESEKYSFRYGFWNTKNNTIIKPRFHDIDINGFKNGLIYILQDGQIGYIDANGKTIWREQKKSSLKHLNIDYMNRGYFYASSGYQKDLAGYGGWGRSENHSKAINTATSFPPNKLQVIIDTKQKCKWAEKYEAVKLFIANTSADTLYFSAQDSRLYLKIQALDKNGEWRDIEYLPDSWCGNSYHTLFLAPNEFWEFATPVYHGGFKTKIRSCLFYKKSKKSETIDTIYSNEIDGYVNPGQFWNKKAYYPRGIMDPYNE